MTLASVLMGSIPSAAAGAAASQLDVWRDGDRFEIHASAVVAADPRVAWETLTDHERLPQFIDGISSSRIAERRGDRLIVEHAGSLNVLWLSVPVRARLAVHHQPYQRITAQSVAGQVGGAEQTVRAFDGSYRLTVVTVERRAGVRLDYRAQFELTEPLPPVIDALFGRALVAHLARRQFESLLREIERRQAQRERSR